MIILRLLCLSNLCVQLEIRCSHCLEFLVAAGSLLFRAAVLDGGALQTNLLQRLAQRFDVVPGVPILRLV